MTFKELQYFVAVAETLHFGQAAASFNITQSTLSLQIQRLEAELGVKLFKRNPIHLTDSGARVIPWARMMLVAADELSKAAKQNLEFNDSVFMTGKGKYLDSNGCIVQQP